MNNYTMFQQPVSRRAHKTRMLRVMRLMTANGLRGSPVRRQQQVHLICNRLGIGSNLQHPHAQAILRRYGAAL